MRVFREMTNNNSPDVNPSINSGQASGHFYEVRYPRGCSPFGDNVAKADYF
jgi:hypothetical protein